MKITTIVSSQFERQCLLCCFAQPKERREEKDGKEEVSYQYCPPQSPKTSSLSPDADRITYRVCALRCAYIAGYFKWVSEFEQTFAVLV